MRGTRPCRPRVKVASISQISTESLAALLLAISLAAALLFPTLAQAQSVEVSGEVNALIAEDLSVGFEHIDYTLTTGDGEVHRLFFNGEPPVKVRTGDYAFVSGDAIDDPTWGTGILVSEIAVLPIAQSVNANSTGTRKALLIRVNFQDQSVSCSKSEIEEMMWTGTQNINGLFEEASFNAVSFPEDTDGDNNPDSVSVTLNENLNGNSCDYSGWAQDAVSKAQGKGVDTSLYQHIILVLPLTNNPCGWAGLGSLGCGSTCYSWTNYCNLPDVLAHELGHNLGLYHARTDTNNDGTADSEYGDTSGIMGYGGVGYRHFNGPHKEDAGWISSSNIRTVTSNGTQTVVALELDPGPDYQIIKTSKPGSTTDFYYFTFRAQEGDYSNNLSSSYSGKLNIHWQNSSSGYSNFIEAIGSGGSWTDGEVTVSNVSTTGTSATFSLTVADDASDDGSGDSGTSVSGYITKNGSLPRRGYLRRLRVIVRGSGRRCRTRNVDTDTGYYSLSNCPDGTARFKIKKRRRNQKNPQVFSNSVGLVNGANSINVDI